MSSQSSSRIIRFSTFELNLRTRELRQQGQKVKLQEQPLQVLAALLERPGEMVSREELRTRLWAVDTFVDFDHGLNAAIKRLRDALGESAEKPIFIETLARRGYRFIAPVAEGAECGVKPARGRTLKRALLITAALILLATGAWWLRPRHEPQVMGWKQLTFSGHAAFQRPSPLATDGRRLYFTVVNDSAEKVGYVSVDGGEQVLMPLPFHHARLRHISPDGSTLLISGRFFGEPHFVSGSHSWGGHLFLVSTAGGGPRRLASVDGQDGAWSPDGNHIIFAAGRDIHVANNDGSTSHKLVTTPGDAYWIRWSPDGKRIRFSVIDPVTSRTLLWECQSDGNDLHRLALSWNELTEPTDECCGEWTSDGRYFMFHTGTENEQEIWLVREGRLPNRNYRPVRLNGPEHKQYAIPSLDSKKIFVTEMEERVEMLQFDLKTRTATTFRPGTNIGAAATSPDRKWVAYVEINGTHSVLWRSRPDGSERLQLTAPEMEAALPRWSPDAKQIAFQGLPTGGDINIYAVAMNGGVLRLMLPLEHNVTDPEWSRDAHSLMFGRAPANWVEQTTAKGISILNLDSNQTTILPGSEGLFSPRWSPSGRYVAALSLNYERLMLFDFTTRQWTQLAGGTANDPRHFDNPRWSPDSKVLYFNDWLRSRVMKIDRSSRRIEQVVDMKMIDLNAAVRRFDNLTPEGSLFISCWYRPAKIYALDVQLP